MISTRLALTALALAIGHAALAQVPQTAATASNASQPPGAAPAAAKAGQPEVEGDKASPSNAAPRLLRGDDQVIAPPKAVPPIEGVPVSFSFEEAPVADVVRTILGDILKTDYVLHPPLTGTVTLATRAPIPPDRAVFLLESALQANGLALLRDARGSYHVGRPDALKGIGGAMRQVGKGPLPPGYGAIVVPLQYIGAGEMAAILRPMVQPDAIVRVDNVRNLLVLAGTRTQAEGWMDIVNTFDVNLLKGMSVGVFPLKYATIKEVEAALRLVSGGSPAPQGGATASPQQGGSAAAAAGNANQAVAMLGEGNPLFGALRIMPIERLNSILVVTPRAAYLEEARRWIEKLDQPSDGGAEAQLFIYRVQNGNAKHLASVLAGIFGGTTAATGTPANSGVAPGLNTGVGTSFGQQPFGAANTVNTGLLGRTGTGLGTGAFGNTALNAQNRLGQQQNMAGQQTVVAANLGGVRVMADELNNSILVWSTRNDFVKIESTLKRLDTPPTQVLIEASIIEVTLNDTLNYGLQWAFDGGAGNGYQGIGQIGPGQFTPGTGSLGDKTSAGQGFSYSLVNSAGKIRLALTALSQKTMVKMISNPSLMVLDNHQAMMTVGNQVPVLTSTTDYINTTGASTSTVQYRDTGVSLAVTPSVNAGNLVSMQIDQTVTDVSDTTSSTANNQPAFMQRQISSKVAVRSGESIVLGGLIKDNETRGKTGVPLLQDLPLVGNLFGTNTRGGGRTELLVVITPKVVRTDPEIREVSEELRDRLKGLEIIELRDRAGASRTQGSSLDPVQPMLSQ